MYIPTYRGLKDLSAFKWEKIRGVSHLYIDPPPAVIVYKKICLKIRLFFIFDNFQFQLDFLFKSNFAHFFISIGFTRYNFSDFHGCHSQVYSVMDLKSWEQGVRFFNFNWIFFLNYLPSRNLSYHRNCYSKRRICLISWKKYGNVDIIA